ncbi:uncharacterized protein K441DRAFT_676962 [Cenococcum geophilum 1.58]|uniref:uncharacterized protein n=1 Tax=Cenococcum geophilum 1.58 TaxID=794803 RepID=UPI00358F064B|nr:hypothetical protein K441DRAFT_676962 [Cenococcum geophilum 1.58]
MASPTHKVLQFSPAKLNKMLQSSPAKLTNLTPPIPSTPIRKKQPLPEKKCLPSTTVLSKQHTSTATDSGPPEGLKAPEEGETDYIHHTWNIFENGSEPIDGSCGPIFDKQGMVVALFRFKIRGDQGCLAVSAMELRRFGYKICCVEQQF